MKSPLFFGPCLGYVVPMSVQKSKRKAGGYVSVRCSPALRKQLDDLIRVWGENQSQVITRAVERAWSALAGKRD